MYGKVFFLSTARLSDKVLIASASYNGKSIEISAVKQMLQGLQAMDSGKLYAFAMGNYAWSVMEQAGVIYVVATAADYPSRVSAQCLNDCARLFVARVQDQWRTCLEGALSETCKKLLGNLCEKYDNLAEMDKVTATMAKVEAVKMQMADNIQESLKNAVLMEKIEDDAKTLQDSAGIFKQQAKSLKSKMWWKNCKMKLLICAITLAILGTIALIVAAQVGAFDQTDDDDDSKDKHKDKTTSTTAPAPAPARLRW